MLHTSPWSGAEIYRPFVQLTQNPGVNNFKHSSVVWTSVDWEQKPLFEGKINASDLEDNLCESKK